ncbi:MAG: IS30 family transposase [Pseudonocardiaceae bacterium]
MEDGVARGSVLCLGEREEISRGIVAEETGREIGLRIGRHFSVVNREIARNGGRLAYRAFDAERKAVASAKRPKDRKVETDLLLLTEVNKGLKLKWSPQQISTRLQKDFPEDEAMRVSHEAIYQALFVQAKGQLKVQLIGRLRTGKIRRVSRAERRAVKENRQAIPGMVMITERPPEVADRAVPGHWEGDLIMGEKNASAIATLVERTSRFVILQRLPYDHTADRMAYALTTAMNRLPTLLKRSLTWDQGREMAQHAKFTTITGIPVFFCDPHSPWQRGTNENTNGLLREYFPKGTDLSGYDQDYLDAVAFELNGRPRQTLDWLKPSEKLNTILLEAADASTA